MLYQPNKINIIVQSHDIHQRYSAFSASFDPLFPNLPSSKYLYPSPPTILTRTAHSQVPTSFRDCPCQTGNSMKATWVVSKNRPDVKRRANERHRDCTWLSRRLWVCAGLSWMNGSAFFLSSQDLPVCFYEWSSVFMRVISCRTVLEVQEARFSGDAGVWRSEKVCQCEEKWTLCQLATWLYCVGVCALQSAFFVPVELFPTMWWEMTQDRLDTLTPTLHVSNLFWDH